MKTNEGTIDRTLRVAVGLILIGMAFTGTIGAWGRLDMPSSSHMGAGA